MLRPPISHKIALEAGAEIEAGDVGSPRSLGFCGGQPVAAEEDRSRIGAVVWNGTEQVGIDLPAIHHPAGRHGEVANGKALTKVPPAGAKGVAAGAFLIAEQAAVAGGDFGAFEQGFDVPVRIPPRPPFSSTGSACSELNRSSS